MLEMLLEDENWFPVVTPVTAFLAIAFAARARRRGVPAERMIVGAVMVFFGLWIGIMGTGHRFAVTTKMILGMLPPRIQLQHALAIGFAIAVPGWLLTAIGMLLLRRPPRANLQYVGGITP